MEVTKTRVDGVLLIKPKVFGDERGYFVETYQKERYSEIGITHTFVQDNHSMSRRGILRGLHYQTKHPQGKLVMVSLGAVFDVAVDIRLDSPTFGKWFGAILSQENQHQLWIPPGLAHGFLVLSDIAHFHYKCTDFYDTKNEASILWNDPELNIEWPFAEDVVLSQKDMNALSFKSAVQLK